MRRVALDTSVVDTGDSGGDYFYATTSRSFPTGCTLLDCVLNGGWSQGRIINIVGDAGTGKTLLAMEAAANFLETYPDGKVFYEEPEAVFDEEYAKGLGIPMHRICLGRPDTVEDFYERLTRRLEKYAGTPMLYILDSLDALTSAVERDRAFDKASYGGDKPKQMGQLFRRCVRAINETDATLIIISQTRDNIGVMFGDRQRVSGGRALKFYASQIVWLAQTKTIKRTIKKVVRTVGIRVRVKCKKNKIGPSFRECDFPLIFLYGVDDLMANLEWLKSVGRLADATGPGRKEYEGRIESMGRKAYRRECARVSCIVKGTWKEVEHRFAPRRQKYGTHGED